MVHTGQATTCSPRASCVSMALRASGSGIFRRFTTGLWDYDNPAAPILGDITVEGRTIRAVMLVTKQGFVFTFDRMTGEPVWPIEERSVPPSAAPGERASETQPFPTKGVSI